jgi:uncharacterized protein YdaU (DUF1376 family)
MRPPAGRRLLKAPAMSARLPNLFMMPWFPRDFLASTRGWPLIPRAIYRELLDAQWEQGGLPADAKALMVIVGATPAEWRAGWSRVAPKFPVGEDGLRRNARLEEHRSKSLKLYDKHSKGAALTNAKRWGAVAERSLSDSLSVSPQSQSQSLRCLRGGAELLEESLQGDEAGGRAQ